MKVRITEDNKVVIGFDTTQGWAHYEDMTPQEAMKFFTDGINLVYPLTRPRQEQFRSSFNGGCHRR